jgi:hypothetical protein
MGHQSAASGQLAAKPLEILGEGLWSGRLPRGEHRRDLADVVGLSRCDGDDEVVGGGVVGVEIEPVLGEECCALRRSAPEHTVGISVERRIAVEGSFPRSRT